jgi:hypothetical protein
MSTTLQRERVRLGGVIERATPGARQTVAGIEYDQKFIASTELLATDGGVIYVDAWRWDRYMKRPRWIAMHDLGGYGGNLTEVSLGRAVHVAVESGLDKARVGPSGKALCVYVRYASTPFAQQVRTLYAEGGLDDVSVRWDWRTEQTRNPYEEEAQQFGEGLLWVCELADLVELSAVLLGADAGAQMVRGEVEAALERCRAKRIALPEVERFIRERRPRSVRVTAAPDDKLPGALSKPFAGYANFAACVAANQDQPHPVTYCAGLAPKKKAHADAGAIDTTAAADALAEGERTVTGIGVLLQSLSDQLSGIQNLVAVNAPAPTEDANAEPTAASEAIGELDDALSATIAAYGQLGGAWARLYDALGVDRAGGPVLIDLDAVLADRPDAVEKLYEAYKRLPVAP